jgi:hypothetical protein
MFYQKMILVIAAVVLIVLLVFFGFYLKKSKQSETWPPIVGKCPDYWVDLSSNGSACFNSHSLGTCNIPTKDSTDKNTMNFDISPFNSDTTNCSKYKWATACGVTWDGITYGVPNPCVSEPESTTTTV